MRLNVELKKEIYDDLTYYASAEGQSISEVVRACLINWIAGKRNDELVKINIAKLHPNGEVRNG